ncbi:hypothetical protein FKM82_030475 [Ascaphus truei]
MNVRLLFTQVPAGRARGGEGDVALKVLRVGRLEVTVGVFSPSAWLAAHTGLRAGAGSCVWSCAKLPCTSPSNHVTAQPRLP